MKALLLLVGILFSFTSYGEVKPEGAIVAAMCGQNYLEVPAGPTYPTEVCTNFVQTYDSNSQAVVIVTLETGLGADYYAVISKVAAQDGGEIWVAYPALVEEGTPYTYYRGTVKDGIAIQIKAYPGQRLVGPMFDVELEHVFTTESVL